MGARVWRKAIGVIGGGSMGKPANLVYGPEEAPPTSVILISGIQHVGVIAIFMIYPLIIGRAAGAPAIRLGTCCGWAC